jgi:hypothetical protein
LSLQSDSYSEATGNTKYVQNHLTEETWATTNISVPSFPDSLVCSEGGGGGGIDHSAKIDAIDEN